MRAKGHEKTLDPGKRTAAPHGPKVWLSSIIRAGGTRGTPQYVDPTHGLGEADSYSPSECSIFIVPPEGQRSAEESVQLDLSVLYVSLPETKGTEGTQGTETLPNPSGAVTLPQRRNVDRNAILV